MLCKQGRFKKTSTQLALDVYDDLYLKFYGPRVWPSVRLALLSQPKYCALVNYYGDYEDTVQSLRDLGCIDILEGFQAERHTISGKRAKRRKGSSGNHNQSDDEGASSRTDPPDDELDASRIITPEMGGGGLHNFVPATRM